MADGTHIEWTEATWNPITGCSVISPGCTNCYAMKLAGTRLAQHESRAGLTVASKAGPVWNGQVKLNEQWLDQPLRWKRPRMIFVCAHGDLFHESVPDEWIDRVVAVMALCPHHTFQVLTKRSARMREYLSAVSATPERRTRIYALGARMLPDGSDKLRQAPPPFPLPNVWLGVSVEDQARANERVADLLQTPAAVRWISAEPLLGPVDLRYIEFPNARGGEECWDALDLHDLPEDADTCKALLDWVVVGGESGAGSRPMHPDWARSLRDQCATAGVPFFFKQWGAWELSLDRDRDDPDWRADYSNDHVDSGKSRWLNFAGGRGFHGDRFMVMRNVGKKHAGRLLDGQLHDAMPAGAV